MKRSVHGFTLIEMSIVLVIIGLIVGGILVGRDLIRSAAVRAQVTQIEKFNQAANAFYGKYGYLPGDIPAIPAAQFGFASRGALSGQGDGNGIIQGAVTAGEMAMFWVDLSTVKLIEGNFNTASSMIPPDSNISQAGVGLYMPAAKMGRGNYLFAFSGSPVQGFGLSTINRNYFCLTGMNGITSTNLPESVPALTVREAYSIDSKIDDGKPFAGNVITFYYDQTGDKYPAGGGTYGADSTQMPASSVSCYDNNNNGNNPITYSISQSGGANVNCALSIRMQAGD